VTWFSSLFGLGAYNMPLYPWKSMEHSQPWERGMKAAKTFVLTVVVK